MLHGYNQQEREYINTAVDNLLIILFVGFVFYDYI